MQGGGLGLIGGVGILIYLVMMMGMVAGYVILLIAVWRGMRAHESIAETLKNYLRLKHKQSNSSTIDKK